MALVAIPLATTHLRQRRVKGRGLRCHAPSYRALLLPHTLGSAELRVIGHAP